MILRLDLGLPDNLAGKESACNAGDPGANRGKGRLQTHITEYKVKGKDLKIDSNTCKSMADSCQCMTKTTTIL